MSRVCHMPPRNCGTIDKEHPLLGFPTYFAKLKLYDNFCIPFDEPGIMLCLSPGYFVPDIPSGVFIQKCLPLTFTAIKEGDVQILFTTFAAPNKPAETTAEILNISKDHDTGDDDCPCEDD